MKKKYLLPEFNVLAIKTEALMAAVSGGIESYQKDQDNPNIDGWL